MSYKKISLAFSAVLLGASISPALATAKPVTRSVEVDMTGLDLTTENDAGILKYRITSAARDVCGMREGLQSLGQQRKARKCFDAAVDGAIRGLVKDRDVHVSLKPKPQG